MKRAWTFAEMEQAVIAELITRPERTLPLAADVELGDFEVPLHAHAFSAVRALEAASAPICVLSVADAIYARSVEHHGRAALREVDVVAELGLLLMDAPRYGRDARELEFLFPRHVKHLRTLRGARELRWRAS